MYLFPYPGNYSDAGIYHNLHKQASVREGMQELKACCHSSLLWFSSAFNSRWACSAGYDTPCLAAITHLITTGNHHSSDLAMFQGDWVLMVYISSTKPPEEPTCSYLLLLCRTHLFFSLLRACLVLSEKKQDQIFTTNPESSHLKLTSCSLERTFKIPKGLQNELWQKKKIVSKAVEEKRSQVMAFTNNVRKLIIRD